MQIAVLPGLGIVPSLPEGKYSGQHALAPPRLGPVPRTSPPRPARCSPAGAVGTGSDERPPHGWPTRLLRSRVTPAFDGDRHRPPVGVRLEGRTGNLPPSGLAPDQFATGSEAAPQRTLASSRATAPARVSGILCRQTPHRQPASGPAGSARMTPAAGVHDQHEREHTHYNPKCERRGRDTSQEPSLEPEAAHESTR